MPSDSLLVSDNVLLDDSQRIDTLVELGLWADEHITTYINNLDHNIWPTDSFPISYMKSIGIHKERRFLVANIGYNLPSRFWTKKQMFIDSTTLITYEMEPISDTLIPWKSK